LVGLASGVTAGSMLCHPMERLECVESVRGMDRAAELFSRENGDCLNDPRFKLIEGDGRNHLLLTDTTYDVIVSQVSSPWVAGCMNLYTTEYFELARRHLNPGSILVLWVQIYSMTGEDLKLVLNTFHNVLPHVTAWQASDGDIVLLGSETELTRDYGFIRNAMSRPGVMDDLASVGLDSFPGLFSCFLLDTEALEKYLAGFARRITDNNPGLEFTMPRTIGQTTHHTRIVEIAAHRVSPEAYVRGSVPEEIKIGLRSAYSARADVFASLEETAQGRPLEAIESLRRALARNPEDTLGRENLSRLLLEYSAYLIGAGDLEKAAPVFDEVRLLGHPLYSPRAASNLAICRSMQGNSDAATRLWRSVSAEVSEANYYLAGYYAVGGFPDSAEAAYGKALELDPNDSDSMNELAWLLAIQGRDLDRALELALRATEIDPSGDNLDTLGWVHYTRGDFDSAVRVLKDCVETWGENAGFLYHLGMAYAKQGQRDLAQRALRNAVVMADDDQTRALATEALRDI
jgi:tetratricopeptide (TPR) repeat protein